MYLDISKLQGLTELSLVGVDILLDLGAAACATFERLTGIKFGKQTHTEVYDGKGDRTLFVKNTPVVNITSVTITYSDSETEVLLGNNFRINSTTGKITFKPDSRGYFPTGEQNISIIYVAGSEPVEPEVELATQRLVLEFYRALTTTSGNILRERLGEYSVTYGTVQGQVPNDVMSVIKMFARRIVLP